MCDNVNARGWWYADSKKHQDYRQDSATNTNKLYLQGLEEAYLTDIRKVFREEMTFMCG